MEQKTFVEGSFEYTVQNGQASIALAKKFVDTVEFVNIPENAGGYPVTAIASGAFANCKKLVEAVIPCSITSIGENAFDNCYSLIEITIPNSVIHIEAMAFSDCASLPNVIIPNSVTSIAVGVFFRCYSLTTATIPNSVISIGDEAFDSGVIIIGNAGSFAQKYARGTGTGLKFRVARVK